ncbi:MAG TPA: HD domain-containing phosphohydrolase, partial [Limnochordia bacterium]
AALLHDVGKVRIPAEILHKPGPLSAEEQRIVREHARHGYEILSAQAGVPAVAAEVAYQHHERLDGTGYPRGLSAADIHPFARITGVIDVFDAMTSEREFRSAFPPAQVLDLLSAGAGVQFDADTVRSLVLRVAPYPIGCCVRLDTGETAVVVDVNRRAPRRPVVRVVAEASGRSIDAGAEIDLEKEPERSIVGVGDPEQALAAVT